MTMKQILFFTTFLFALCAQAQGVKLKDYLPQDVTYNQNIPTPSDIIGFVPGDWHVSHDKLVQYMRAIAESSDRVRIKNRGFTYEKRPLILLTITSPKNHKNLAEIQENHLKIISGEVSESQLESMPIVVESGYFLSTVM